MSEPERRIPENAFVALLAENLAQTHYDSNLGYGDEGWGYDFVQQAQEILKIYNISPKEDMK